jgi:hypothetical protein
MDRRALIVGINHYEQLPSLDGCVADAEAVAELLRCHEDGSPNFDCWVEVAPDRASGMRRADLRPALNRLFEPGFKGEALFYYSGHGMVDATGGYLATSDAETNDVGIPMSQLIDLANSSKACDICIMLDCCHAGALGNASGAADNPFANMREGITIIAASGPQQQAMEAGGHGLFTAAVIDSLSGGAADHMGWVTPPSIYGYVERRFGGWGQRPVYKTHTDHLAVVRKCAPIIDRADVVQLTTHFPTADSRYGLDPEFEPEDEEGNIRGEINEAKVALAHLFKRYRDAGFLKPVKQGEQLYWTARHGHDVVLTPRGKEYWGLVKRGRV